MRDSATSRTCRSPREALLRRQRLPIEAPRRRDATNRHGKACRARLGGSASRAARATPSVTCASRLSRLACCLHRALDPVDRPARCDGGRLLRYDSARSALWVGAGRAPPTFEPEPAVPSGQPSRRRRRRLTPHNHAVPVVINPLRARLAHRPTAESSPTRSSSSVSCADLVDFPARREPQPHSQPGRARARPSPSRMPYY